MPFVCNTTPTLNHHSNCCAGWGGLEISLWPSILWIIDRQSQSSKSNCNLTIHQQLKQFKCNLPNPFWHTAQWSRCQLRCSCSQNFPCKLGSCYRSILSEIRVWKSQKNNISLGCLDPNTLRQIFLEISWQNWPFKMVWACSILSNF